MKIFEKILCAAVFLLMVFASTDVSAASLTYRVHASGYGWMSAVSDGETAGTTGEGRGIEAIQIRSNSNIQYTVYTNGGWQNWASNNEMAGTTGKSKAIEAIRIQASGQDIYYRVHVSGIGWMDWKSNGQVAGTTNEGRAIEAIEITFSQPRSSNSRRSRYDSDDRRYSRDDDRNSRRGGRYSDWY